MSSARIVEEKVPGVSSVHDEEENAYEEPPRNVAYIDHLEFPAELQPKNYEIEGTHPDSQILFLDVNILEATGRLLYRGDVLIKGSSETLLMCTALTMFREANCVCRQCPQHRIITQ